MEIISLLPQQIHIITPAIKYQKSTTETMTSTDPNADGWTQAGFEWQQSGSGTRDCADFPAGFDRNHALYAKYTAASTDANIRREVTSSVPVTYIYWQWAWNTELGNYYINYTSDGDGNRSAYPYFHAFESATAYGQTQPNGYTDSECYYCVDYPGGSWWWFRFEVYRQTYTDYQKLFTYTRTVTSEENSAVPIDEGEGISNVQHWVKYTM